MIIVTYSRDVTDKEFNEQVVGSNNHNEVFCYHLWIAMHAFMGCLKHELENVKYGAPLAFPLNVRFDVDMEEEGANARIKLTAKVTSLRNRGQLDLSFMEDVTERVNAINWDIAEGDPEEARKGVAELLKTLDESDVIAAVAGAGTLTQEELNKCMEEYVTLVSEPTDGDPEGVEKINELLEALVDLKTVSGSEATDEVTTAQMREELGKRLDEYARKQYDAGDVYIVKGTVPDNPEEKE